MLSASAERKAEESPSLFNNITDRKRMEDELRASSLYSRSLMEASLDPLVTISPEGQITDVNRATELVTGVDRQSLIGSNFSQILHRAGEGRRRLSEGPGRKVS